MLKNYKRFLSLTSVFLLILTFPASSLAVNNTNKTVYEKTINGTINIYPDKVTNKINSKIFGIHVPAWNETIFNNRTINKRMLNNLKEAGINYIVYPGGNFGYDFIWNKPNSPNEMNTDELVDLSRQLNASIKISLNPNASPELAAEWINYVNKKLKANVKYWEVADEPYLTMKVDDFINKMKEFVPIMKKADPSIKIIANVSICNENYTKKVIKELGNYIDVYSIHYFPLSPSKKINQLSPYEENNKELFYKDLLNSTQQLDEQLNTLKEWVKEANLTKKVEYQIGSFAPVWWGPEDWTTNSLPDGLWTADMLGTFAKEDITGAAFWALMNPYPPAQGDFGMFSPEMKPYVSYYPYVLFNKHFGKEMIENNTDIKDISVYSSLSDDHKNLYIMVINKSPDKNYQVNFNLNKFIPRGDADAWILDGPVIADNPTNYGLRKETINNINSSFIYDIKPYSVVSIEIPNKNSKLNIADTPNLALNKSAEASSIALNTDSKYYKTYDYVPDKALDGDLTTRWASKIFTKDNEWFGVDLGSIQEFNQIKINWEYWATKYDVEISNDGVKWDKIADQNRVVKEKIEPQPIDVINLNNPVDARYIRINMYGRPESSGSKASCSQWTPDAYSIWEFGVYLK
ncbi:discoidin domain-containing protein [Thermoanaerobacterium thermosaccharolyticum]|uniref:discoidin domain-containing protein n=1 Tax=Thermoanaerobacterium thermosaccharolyticum TaxID=1517 RepID=UPI003DAA3E66